MRSKFTSRQRRAYVREWKRSGLSAKAFAEGQDFHPVTLCKWSREDVRGAMRVPRLLEVVPTSREERESSAWAWELKGPGGELRGAAIDAETLLVLVHGIVGGRR